LRLLFVGRLSPQKDLPLLFDAVRVLGPKAELVVAGDGELRHDVEAMARVSLSGQVRVVGAQTPNSLASGTGGLTSWCRHRSGRACPSASWRRWRAACPSWLPTSPGQGKRWPAREAGATVGDRSGGGGRRPPYPPTTGREMGAAGRHVVEPLRWSRITEMLEEIYDGIS